MARAGLPAFNEFRPKSLLRRPAHVPERARFAVIDAHNHLFADRPAEEIVAVMDAVGVQVFLNVTGNCSLPFDAEGYTIRRRDLAIYLQGWTRRVPGRFAAFTLDVGSSCGSTWCAVWQSVHFAVVTRPLLRSPFP